MAISGRSGQVLVAETSLPEELAVPMRTPDIASPLLKSVHER